MKVQDIEPGTVVEGLRIEGIAGRGGSSVVYRASDLATGRPLAVKVLLSADASSRRRLAREAELLATVRHTAIVPFRGLRGTDEHDILLTDWVDGESLSERSRRLGPLSAEAALEVLWALAEPLDHLHGLDIVHRDITPANIIVGPDGTFTIIDLGIGHHVESSTMTSDDLLAGTPKYLAPEIIRGEAATGQADQYSVGVLIHELITGQSPFPVAERVATALHHQLHTVPVPLDEVDPTVPSRLADAVLRSLQKEPDRRFDSMLEFARVASVTTQQGSPITVSARAARGRRRATSLKLGAAAVVAAFLGAGALLAPGNRAADDETGTNAAASFDDSPVDDETGTTLIVAVDITRPEAVDTATSGSTRPTEAPSDTGVWIEGSAATTGCNLLTGHTFTDGAIPIDYFGEPPGRERVVSSLGFGDSNGLEVGQDGAFGQFGEIVPIQPGETYLLRGWFRRAGEIDDAEIGISFLTPDYEPLSTGGRIKVPDTPTGFVQLTATPAPSDAGFAVPYLFKDGSVGVLIADELVFGRASACTDEIGTVES